MATRIAIETIYAMGPSSMCNHGLGAAELAFMSRSEIGGKTAHVYGDSEMDILVQLLELMRGHLHAEDTFVDLGSGSGRLTMYFAALTPVAKAIGVELSPTRHAQAIKAQRARALQLDAGPIEERLEFVCASMLQHDVAGATIVFCFCLCLDAPFLTRLESHLLARLPLGAVVVLRGKRFPRVAQKEPDGQPLLRRLELRLQHGMYFAYCVVRDGDESREPLRPRLKQTWEDLGTSAYRRAYLVEDDGMQVLSLRTALGSAPA